MLPQIYREIAERHVEAARILSQTDLHEIAIFHCYHAFEAIACAAIALRQQHIPRTHRGKIQRFIQLYRAFPFARGVSAVAATVIPLRNKALYPELSPGPTNPSQLFVQGDAQHLIQRVNGAVRTISQALGL